MKKIVWLLALAAGFLLCSCNSQEKKLDKAMAKAVACAELGTVEYTITKLVIADDEAFYKFGDRKIIFSCNTTMKAGINLEDFKREDVVPSKDGKSVNVLLPQPKILSFNMSAENVKLEYSKTTGLRTGFNTSERNNLLKQGEKAIIDDAPNLGIYEDAKKNAAEFFRTLLGQCGYENVNISFKGDNAKS